MTRENTRTTVGITAMPDPDVPYGYIHYDHQSEDDGFGRRLGKGYLLGDL